MKDRIFTARQALFASMIGGPVGGLYTLWRNISLTENATFLAGFIFFGCVPVLAYLVFAPVMPWPLTLGFLPVFCLGVYLAAQRIDAEKAMVRLARRWTVHRDRSAYLVGVVALVASLVFEFVWGAFLWGQ